MSYQVSSAAVGFSALKLMGAGALTAVLASTVGPAAIREGTTGPMVLALWPLIGGILIRDTFPCVVIGGLTLLATHFTSTAPSSSSAARSSGGRSW